jgi:hypothetical protein
MKTRRNLAPQNLFVAADITAAGSITGAEYVVDGGAIPTV